MNFPISLYIALRYWRAKSADRFGRLVTNLASLGIVLGVMALIIVLSVMNGLEGYQNNRCYLLFLMRLWAKSSLFLQKNARKFTALCPKAVPINTTNVIYQTAKGVSAGQIIGIQSFSDDPLVESFDQTKFNEILPRGEFKLVIGDQLAQKTGREYWG